EIVHLVLNLVVFIEQTADAPDPPIAWGAHAQLVTLVSVALSIVPGRAWSEALRSLRSQAWICALIVVHVRTACVARVVLDLLDVTHEVVTRIEELQSTDTAVDRQRGIL